MKVKVESAKPRKTKFSFDNRSRLSNNYRTK